ncbi:MAG TPA: serine/threonine protein kinase [Planctomycetaceae bacterium]|nr:serine/threonine protein kinase [Planctomycetaceae bacterium]
MCVWFASCSFISASSPSEPLRRTVDATTAAAEVDDGMDISPNDWPWWRGPERNGTATSGQTLPSKFSATENIVWSADVPGRGLSSPTVVGSRVFLTTADDASGEQRVLCFDRNTGRSLWDRQVHASGGMQKNNKSTAASSSVSCDGEQIYVAFPNSGALIATALTLNGNTVWQKKVSDYVVHQGYGASPVLYQGLVIVAADNKGGGQLAAFDKRNGQLIWSRERPRKPNYPTPTLVHVDGKDQLILVGCDLVVSYNPLTGETNWSTQGATTECVTSTLTDGKHIFTSGGYPKNHMSAILADGSAELVWENNSRLYVPSLVIRDGYLYGILDAGIATCWEAATGKMLWRERLGGTFSSSPVLVGDTIYATNEAGDFFIFKASPDGFEKIAKNKLGEQVLSTPTICGNRIYHRVAHLDQSGNRTEKLYCIGQ